ncbi:MAG: phosphatase PAP2 family protein [Gemmatimonadaceae bacterium]|nr:phosphatase PAP2 family protein [Gemmatimonadaceae bacterium]
MRSMWHGAMITRCIVALSASATVVMPQGPVQSHATIGASSMRAPRASSTNQYARLGVLHADAWKLGGLTAAALLVATADRRGDAWARHPGVQGDATLDVLSSIGDKSGVIVAPAVGPALWLLGRARGDSGTAVSGLRTTEALLVSGATVTLIKLLAGRTRPFASADHSPTHWDLFGGFHSDSTRSFASGHAALAAAVAVTLAAEWRRQGTHGWQTVGPPSVYALATLTAASRVRDRKHWMSDVVSGAALGVLGALVVRRWHDAHPQSRIDRALLRQ